MFVNPGQGPPGSEVEERLRAAGGAGKRDFWKALELAIAGYSVLHAADTKQFQGWHAVALTIGLISAIS